MRASQRPKAGSGTKRPYGRSRPSIGSLSHALTSRIGCMMASAAALLLASLPAHAQQIQVDLELVLAVDISQSMSPSEQALQRNGYVEAFRSREVVSALMSGPSGKIAVTYMEWAGDFEPWQTVPWTIIDSEASARAFADRLAEEPIFGEQRTSLSSALIKATQLIEENDIISIRKVIDVSGDGANNAGRPVEPVRDEVVRRGITINGLPIILEKPREFYDIDHLDRYYKHCVIGGTSAFIAPVFDLKHMAATIRKKLVLEIAGRMIEPDTAPVQFADAADSLDYPDQPGIQRVQLKLPTEKTDCLIGEKVWGDRRGGGWGGWGGDFPRP